MPRVTLHKDHPHRTGSHLLAIPDPESGTDQAGFARIVHRVEFLNGEADVTPEIAKLLKAGKHVVDDKKHRDDND